MKKSNRNNFTFLELLILIGVILCLAPMILPALSQGSHGKEKQAQCTRNLSQIGKAFCQYAMSWDDWYPTTIEVPQGREGIGKWTGNPKALDLLRSQDLLTDPKGYMCPSNPITEQAENNKPLRKKNISYAWNDGLMGTQATMSAICSDGLTNHTMSGRFVRGDGSTANTAGANWYKKETLKTNEDMTITF